MDQALFESLRDGLFPLNRIENQKRDLILRGYVAFLDPPKDSARLAIEALHMQGVAVKILTGDNHLISRKVCKDVRLDPDPTLLGGDVEKMSDADLAKALMRRAEPAT